MTNWTASQLVYVACGLGGVVIFAGIVAALVVAAAALGEALA